MTRAELQQVRDALADCRRSFARGDNRPTEVTVDEIGNMVNLLDRDALAAPDDLCMNFLTLSCSQQQQQHNNNNLSLLLPSF